MNVTKTINRKCPLCRKLNQPANKSKAGKTLILFYECSCGKGYTGRCDGSRYRLTAEAVDRVCKPELKN